jgi:hypothetical protein
MATEREVIDAIVKEVRRIGEKLDSITGPGVVNRPTSITIGNTASGSKGFALPGPTIVPVRVVANETGSELYSGTAYAGVQVLNPSSNPPSYSAGMVTNRSVVVFNTNRSCGTNTHSLNPPAGGLYGAGFIVGHTNETPPRDIVWWLGDTSPMREVSLTTSSGSAGGSNSICSFVYSGVDYMGCTYSVLSPRRPQVNGKRVEATAGIVSLNPGTNDALIYCNEEFDTDPDTCP